MPQLSAVVLKDHADSDVTFNPRDIANGVATLANSTGVPLGDRQVSIARNRTATGRQKVTMKMAIPIVQDSVVNGISKPTIVRSAYADVTMTFEATSSTVERQDALAFLKSFLGNTTLVKPIVEDLASPF